MQIGRKLILFFGIALLNACSGLVGAHEQYAISSIDQMKKYLKVGDVVEFNTKQYPQNPRQHAKVTKIDDDGFVTTDGKEKILYSDVTIIWKDVPPGIEAQDNLIKGLLAPLQGLK